MTIYILHGWDLNSDIEAKWQNFKRELEFYGFNTKLVLLPGFNNKSLEKSLTLNDYVKFVKNKIDKKNNIILGHSFGGQIAIRLASQNPQLFSHLILMDNSGLKDMRLKKIIKRKIGFILAKIGKIFTKNKKMERFLYKMLKEKDYYNSPALLKKTMSSVLNDSIKNDLEKIKIPTLVIWGQKDGHTPLYFTKIIQFKIKNSIIKTIPDAFHNPYFTHPKICAKFIKNWLKK